MSSLRPDELPPHADLSELEETTAAAAPAGAQAVSQPKRGPFLDEPDEAKVARRVKAVYEGHVKSKATKNRRARWKRNRYWREGKRAVALVPDTDEDTVRVWVAPGASLAPVPNKLQQLVRRVCATLTVDPPVLDCEPATDQDEDRSAAEFSARVLATEGSDAGFNLLALLEDVIDTSSHMASAFAYFRVDPQGGGHRPVELKAHPNAVSATEPLVDPATGEYPPNEAGYVTKFKRPDGSLADGPVGAEREWLPKLVREVLSGHHVALLPETCGGVADADGVLIARPTTLAQLRAQFPDVLAGLSDERMKKLVSYTPQRARDLLPPAAELPKDETRFDEDGRPKDEAMVFPFAVYYRSGPLYPMGAYVVTCGDELLHRQEWKAVVEGEGGREEEEPLDIPLAQMRQFRDTVNGDPYGLCLCDELGTPEELRAQQFAALVEYLYRFNNPNNFLPIGSIIQPDALTKRDGTPIFYNPEAGPPVFEQVPPFPQEGREMLDRLTAEMNSIAGLEEAAQGVSTPEVKSGIHAQQIIEQALVALSPVKHGAEEFLSRAGRICLQQFRGFYTQPVKLKIVGEDGSYKLREWTRTDLRTTRDVKIQRGSFTLMSRSAKQALARDELEIGIKVQDPTAYTRYRRVMSGNVDPQLGVDDDPHLMRVRQQVCRWREGPPQEAVAAGAQYQAALPQMQAMAAQQPPPLDATGQPVPPPLPPDPLYAAASALFLPLPVDEEPQVARVRCEELGAALAGHEYQKHPRPWQTALEEAYLIARQAAGIQTVAEQQMAAQQQQQTEQAQKAEQSDGERQEQGAARAHESREKDKDRVAEAERASMQAAAKQGTAMGMVQ